MLGEPGVRADRARAGAAELDAVVGRGVVAGGEHRGRGVERAGGEVALVGRAQADRDARRRRGLVAPRANAAANSGRRVAHVVADDDGGGRRRPAHPRTPAAIASTTSGVSCEPTRPRTSYAFTNADRSIAAHASNIYVSHDLPPLRCGEALGVPRAEVVAVRLDGRGERAEHRHRVGVVVGERASRLLVAGDLAAQASAHRAISVRPGCRVRVRVGSWRGEKRQSQAGGVRPARVARPSRTRYPGVGRGAAPAVPAHACRPVRADRGIHRGVPEGPLAGRAGWGVVRDRGHPCRGVSGRARAVAGAGRGSAR